MEKLELLKQKISEICSNKKYSSKCYAVDDWLFIFKNNSLLGIPDDVDYYFASDFTEEESKEAKRIETELELDYAFYFPIMGGVIDNLESLIEYYCDDDDDKTEAKIQQIQRLQEELNKKDSVFYKQEKKFLNLFLYPELESGVPYVHSQWDHDEAYYYELPYSIGVDDSLYDVITGAPELCIPKDYEHYDSNEEIAEDCDYWINVLTHLDDYIMG